MKKATVFQIVSAVSLVLSALLTATIFLIQLITSTELFSAIEFTLFFVFALIITSTFVYLLVYRFFNEKLKIIYRIIYNSKNPRKAKKTKLAKDAFEQTLRDVTKWSEENDKEFERLKELEEFRREFVGNIAHELKTPVFTVQGYLLTLLDGGLEDESVNRKFLERANNGINRMAKIIDDLDVINQIESEKMELNRTNFNIVELAREAVEELEILAKAKGVTVSFDKLPKDVIIVNADRRRISQVLLNLISNSIHYGKENGTTKIRFYEIENDILVEVADDGAGIDPKHLPRLFERFYRVDKSRSRNEGGTGLGLAIVKHIIEAHDQSVKVRSTVDVGSTFSFTLPRA